VTLTEFLTARLDEDEAVARDNKYGESDHEGTDLAWYGLYVEGLALCIDPARVLAEVAAKRAIVGLHEVMPWRLSTVGYVQDHDGRRWAQHYYGGCCSLCTAGGEYGGNVAEFDTDEPDYCDTLRHLAAVYADHQDFREEWRV
jgi:hypothetical protein